jgi:hypothetical protein
MLNRCLSLLPMARELAPGALSTGGGSEVPGPPVSNQRREAPADAGGAGTILGQCARDIA